MDLDELEEKITEMFNARQTYGKQRSSSSSYSESAIAAIECADMLLRIRQQRHLEEGNPHLVPQNNNHRNIRRFTKKQK